MINALTIDVEDYYMVEAFANVVKFEDWSLYESRVEVNTQLILDILDEYEVKATFFVLGWVADRSPKLVRMIQDRGHEVASHGYTHRRIYTQSPDKFREETRMSKKILEDIIGQAVIGYRAASYSITKKSLWAVNILIEEGFQYDSSIFPIKHDLYGISGHKRFSHILNGEGNRTITEFPLSTLRLGNINIPVGGGGYLRMFPYHFTRKAIEHLNVQERQPAIVYLHPWELDPGQPRIKGKWKSRFRHYTNLKGMRDNLERLLSVFSFAPIRKLYEHSLSKNTDRY